MRPTARRALDGSMRRRMARVPWEHKGLAQRGKAEEEIGT